MTQKPLIVIIKMMMNTSRNNAIQVLLIFKRGRVEESMRTLLSALDYIDAIHQADDLKSAMHVMSNHHPELVLFDFDLTESTPIVILTNIKEKWCGTNCIAVADSAHKLRSARDAGADHTMLKGFLAGELFDSIAKLFDIPRSTKHPIRHRP